MIFASLVLVASAVLQVTADTRYDYQVILMVQPDDVVREYANALYNKHGSTLPQTILEWTNTEIQGYEYVNGVEDFRSQLVKAKKARIYVVAHGGEGPDGTEVGVCSARDTGMILRYLIGDATSNIGRISLVACNIHNIDAPLDDSFVSQLLTYLYLRGINTEISARTTPVAVNQRGQKVTKKGDKLVHKAEDTKIVAYIDSKGQVAYRKAEYSEAETEAVLPKQRRSDEGILCVCLFSHTQLEKLYKFKVLFQNCIYTKS